MKKIFSTNNVSKLSETLHEQNQRIVLVGGCFDVLHLGHITFLRNAKAQGDFLLVLLESDAAIKKMKGSNRPINTQHDRAAMLAALEMVDAVVTLPANLKDSDYDSLVNLIKPAIIATTAGDKNRQRREEQVELIGAKVVEVVEPIANKSTTRLIKILNEL